MRHGAAPSEIYTCELLLGDSNFSLPSPSFFPGSQYFSWFMTNFHNFLSFPLPHPVSGKPSTALSLLFPPGQQYSCPKCRFLACTWCRRKLVLPAPTPDIGGLKVGKYVWNAWCCSRRTKPRRPTETNYDRGDLQRLQTGATKVQSPCYSDTARIITAVSTVVNRRLAAA